MIQTTSSSQHSLRGFSLIEVVIATAVFATAIVAIIGLMSPLSRGVADVVDSEVAARLAGGLQSELKEVTWATVTSNWFLSGVEPGSTSPIELVANVRGDLVRFLTAPSGVAPADRPLNDATLPGIADRERYFLIRLVRQAPFDAASSGSLALRAEVIWPYRLPEGPASLTATEHDNDSSILAQASSQQSLSYFFALTP